MNDRIEKTIEIEASIERVWDALTNHEEFGAWFQTKLDGPFAVGGVVRALGPDQKVLWRARVEAMDAPKLFAYAWTPEDFTDGEEKGDAPETKVTFQLEETAAGVRLTVVESGFAALPADRRDASMRANERGWEIQGENLRAYVTRGS